MRKASCHHEKLKMSGSGKKSGKELLVLKRDFFSLSLIGA